MHFTGQVYRHPMEGATPLLEVTAGCSHNKCTFCTMYRQTPFKVSPTDHIEEDLQEMKRTYGKVDRIFLVNGEPFVLSTRRLASIAKKIIHVFPDIETITCYTSIQNIMSKSLEDLRLLKDLRFNELHIGLESAYDPALKMMNKGFTKKEAYESLDKLSQAGISWDALLMTGVAGEGKMAVNVEETAKLLNTYPPYMVSIMPLSVTKGSDLEVLKNSGEFVESTELENLQEQIRLIEALTFDDAYLFASHNYSLIPVSGHLKRKKEIISYINQRIEEVDNKTLESVLPRAAI